MKTEAHRVAAYNARMQSSLVDPTLSAKNQLQKDSFATYVADFYPNQVAMRAILSAAGINRVSIGAYEAYHGELYHATKVVEGDALVAAATDLITKWSDTHHLGATAAATLTLIATDVYHIVFPGTP